VGGFLRFLVLFVGLGAVLVLVVLPLALSPVLTQQVREMGLRSETLQVSVAMFDPLLVLGRSKLVSLEATGVDVASGRIGRLELALANASYFDRSYETVSGQLTDLDVTIGNETFGASEIAIEGPAEAAAATIRMSEAEATQLIKAAARRAGLTVDDVQLTDSGVRVAVRGLETAANVAVRGGALVIDTEASEPIVLVQPATSDPWRLEEAWVSAESLNVRGTVDVESLVSELIPNT
jgi:hypothetical protein